MFNLNWKLIFDTYVTLQKKFFQNFIYAHISMFLNGSYSNDSLR